MFDIGRLPDPAARLWEAATVAAGGRHDVAITVGPERMTITRMALIEAIFADVAPTQDDVEEWVVATAQRLGFERTELTENGTDRNPGRMTIRVPVDGFTVEIQGFWDAVPS